VLALRDERPAWSKYKLAVMLERDFGIIVSASSAGRIQSRYGGIEANASTRRKRATAAFLLTALGAGSRLPSRRSRRTTAVSARIASSRPVSRRGYPTT